MSYPRCDDDFRDSDSGRSAFEGDYNDSHPDETEEEFWDHEDYDDD
jgi:hypothetical protein